MSYAEAMAWLRGERSSTNYAWGETIAEAQVGASRMDAAMTEQAYWIVRAHKEGLVKEVSE